jgi:ABC-type transporter Mla maintaining outer membrane lipid asymmetry ATPase subunit MlaF
MSASVQDKAREDARPTGVPVIDMRSVTVGALRDPRIVVAEEVNWRVERGEFWAVAGLHGAGKSDLLMLAGGIMAPAGGSYDFLGEGMPIFSEERLAHRLKLGLVFEGGRLFNQLTVAENIALPLRYHRNLPPSEVEPVVSTLIELMGLSQWAHTRPGSLGRNWQRRAALARALALKPELLLLDAPVTGLDLRQRDWWFNFLDELSRGHPWYEGRPVTLVVTTANLRDWRGRARQFAMLEGRRFNVLGDWAAVERSNDPLVRELVAGEGRETSNFQQPTSNSE